MGAFAPIGPAVVTKEEVGDPHNLNLSCTVNGDVKQVLLDLSGWLFLFLYVLLFVAELKHRPVCFWSG